MKLVLANDLTPKKHPGRQKVIPKDILDELENLIKVIHGNTMKINLKGIVKTRSPHSFTHSPG